MFKNIPQSRLVLYFLIGGLLPIFIALVNLMSQNAQVNELEKTLSTIEQMALIKDQKQALNRSVMNHYRDADHFYIDKHIESLVFLEAETESLQKIMNQNNFAEDEVIKKRLEFLTQANTLGFSEGVVQSSPLFQEVIETQVHPVEVNAGDLQKVLAQVEGMDIGPFTVGPNRPQLMIIDFKIDKKKISDKNEVFLLNMKLLKREFL